MPRIQVISALDKLCPKKEMQPENVPHCCVERGLILGAQKHQFARNYPRYDKPDIIVKLLVD
jgi:hypothetical protein